ncbi:hypothetical protein HMPREF9521_02503, partial [Enterococcus faecalis TX2134]
MLYTKCSTGFFVPQLEACMNKSRPPQKKKKKKNFFVGGRFESYEDTFF